MELRSEMGPWVVWRRFSQFHKVDMKLRERSLPPHPHPPPSLPSLPSLSLFSPKTKQI